MLKRDTKISNSLPAVANGLEETINEIAGEDMGFCLLVFPVLTKGSTSYISNCSREDMKVLMESLISKWDEAHLHRPLHTLDS